GLEPHLPRQPWIGRGRGGPYALVESGEDREVRPAGADFECAADGDQRMRLRPLPDVAGREEPRQECCVVRWGEIGTVCSFAPQLLDHAAREFARVASPKLARLAIPARPRGDGTRE